RRPRTTALRIFKAGEDDRPPKRRIKGICQKMGRKRVYNSNEEAAQQNRNRAAERSREVAESVKEIAPLPKVLNPERKKRCRDSLLEFMQTYGGPDAEELYTFLNPFCDEQLYMIQTLEDVLLHGGETALCTFRGGCKTTFCEWGLLWAALYGHQKFCVVVAASKDAARRIVANIKENIKLNPALAEDFPEVCYPISKLEGANQRAATQTLDGEPTEIKFTSDFIKLPKVKNAPSANAIIYGVGADSSFRGLRVGKQRPTFVLIDDPQTNKSARSPKQTSDRWENITTSMKGLAGPGVALAMVATITVIRKGDLAEKILEKWNGRRFGILRSLPKNMAAWEEYGEELERVKAAVSNVSERSRIMNEYYIQNRETLDEGAEAAWESNVAQNEISAIQHAMNLYFFDKSAFWSEYMNLPVDEEKDAENLTIEVLESKIRKELPKGIAPLDAEKITAGIDVQKDCLYWLVIAWNESFGGHVLDYGRAPGGNLKMETKYPGTAFEEQVANCLASLAEELAAKVYRREASGEELRIDKIIVDANWGIVTETVKKICRQQRKGWMEPCMGWGKGPDQRFLARKKKIGEERGPEWRKMPLEIKGICRTVTYNTNWWKSFVRNRILTGIHARSALSFYAGDNATHRKLFQHFLGETSSKLTGQYGTIDKWVLIPGEPNHWWDCTVMASVGASVLKVRMPDFQTTAGGGSDHATAKPEKKTAKWVEL
ncbi:MAG: phage terminase large subunit family protein, partial [Planctomycetia bacterium]|nr:phage terminase large subunit family protein [Planctomycetia bacterium]